MVNFIKYWWKRNKIIKTKLYKITKVEDIKSVFENQDKIKCDIKIIESNRSTCFKFITKTLGNWAVFHYQKIENITTGTDLSVSTLLDIENAITIAGQDGTNEMLIPYAIDNFRKKVVFCCFTTIQDLDIEVVRDI